MQEMKTAASPRRPVGGPPRRRAPGSESPFDQPLTPKVLLSLQASCGNAAVCSLLDRAKAPTAVQATSGPADVQRAFAPALITRKTRLHNVVTVPRGNRAPTVRNRGRVGGNLLAQAEVIVDSAATQVSGRETWTKGVNVKPANWDPGVHKAAATSLRGTKLGPAPAYPRPGQAQFPFGPNGVVNVYWHEDLGEFVKIADHPSNDGRWLVRRARDGERATYTPGGAGSINATPPTFVEEMAFGDVTKKGVSPDGWWIVSRRGAQGYDKYNPANGAIQRGVALSPEETRAVKEEAQAGAWRERVGLDPQLAPSVVTTTDIVYHLIAGDVTVHVKGNTADAHYAEQLQAVRDCLGRLQTAGVPLQDGLELYLTSKSLVQEAFHFGPGHVMLTPAMLADPPVMQDEIASGVKGGIGEGGKIRGVAHQVADKAEADDEGEMDRGAKKGIIGCGVVVHEVGHVMHRQHDPDTFFLTQNINFKISDLGADAGAVKVAAKEISHYVAREDNESKLVLEFVAETFTGLVHGEKYSQEVIDFYKLFGGYPTWTDEATVVKAPVDA